MSNAPAGGALGHPHVFLADSHRSNERRAWAVIVLCGAMMVGEIAGGWLFGSIALIADGLHMSTHAGALLLAALAYTYSASHAATPVSPSGPANSETWRAFAARSCWP